MKKINVFLADHDLALSRDLVESIASQEDMAVIGAVKDGKSCLEAETLSSAHVLILTDILPEIDGLSLLKKLKKEAKTPPAVILLTSFPTPYVKEQALEQGVSIILKRPADPVEMIKQARELLVAEKNMADHQKKAKIRQHLEYYGIPAHLGGFQYLCEVLQMISGDESLLHNLQNGIFQSISEKYNTSPMSIERRIQYAIQVAWYRKSNVNPMRKAFADQVPSVKAFIGFLGSSIH